MPFAVGYAAPPGGARLGGYSLDYRICADFELELRYLYLAKLRTAYLPECVVVMRMGGASTSGWRSNVEINVEDLRALRSHGIWSCLPLIYLKYLFKIWGFVFKSHRTPNSLPTERMSGKPRPTTPEKVHQTLQGTVSSNPPVWDESIEDM